MLERATRRPLEVGVSQHCTGARRAWSEAAVVPGTGHPVVHVAVGSHANELDAGVNPIDARCIPADALAFLEAQGLPAPADVALPGPVLAPAGVVAGAEPLALRTLTRTWPRWSSFDGDWGEDQLFRGPPPIGTVTFGTSPEGPAQHALWQRPLRTMGGWAVR